MGLLAFYGAILAFSIIGIIVSVFLLIKVKHYRIFWYSHLFTKYCTITLPCLIGFVVCVKNSRLLKLVRQTGEGYLVLICELDSPAKLHFGFEPSIIAPVAVRLRKLFADHKNRPSYHLWKVDLFLEQANLPSEGFIHLCLVVGTYDGVKKRIFVRMHFLPIVVFFHHNIYCPVISSCTYQILVHFKHSFFYIKKFIVHYLLYHIYIIL